MTYVTRYPDEDIDSLLKRFDKVFKASGVARAYKDRKAYVKPSTINRSKRDLKKKKSHKQDHTQ
ncbi:30S ribosomal protein S21, partial [Chloroflexota bacterium]